MITTYGNHIDLSCVKRALIVKMRNYGDVLLATPVFSILKNIAPDAQIDAFVYKDCFEVLDGHPAINNILTCERANKHSSYSQRLFSSADLLRTIRNSNYDLIINLTEGDRGAIAALASRAMYRVGWDPENSGFLFKKNIYTHLVKRCKTPRHMVEQNIDALRRIGINPVTGKDIYFNIPISAKDNISNLLNNHGIQPGSFILIHPASRWRFKCWLAKSYAKFINALSDQGYQIVLSVSTDKSELDMLDELAKECTHANILNLGGKINIKELGALIKACKCIVCSDSLPLHISSALKKPALAIFGPSSEKVWGPWMNVNAKVISAPYTCRPCNLDGCGGSKISDCLYALTPEIVYDAFTELVKSIDHGKCDG